MNAVYSRITPTDPGLSQNRAEMEALIARMRRLEARTAARSEARRPIFDKRGQLSPRDRLAALLDPGLPFLDLYNMASYLVDDPDPETSVPGASILAGIGFVAGVRVMVFVDDAGINAGAMTQKSVDKALGVLAIAERQKLPFLHLVESAGADLVRYTVELWAHGGAMFAGLARLSAAGIPVITVLHGAATAGGAYQPGLSDYVVGVRGNGMAMLAGAALVQAATGEEATDAALGSAEMHAEVTGLVDYLAEDDAEALEIARGLVDSLDWPRAAMARRDYAPPDYPADDILNVVSADYRRPYDMGELALRLVDGGSLRAFKPAYGADTLCWQARIMGHAVGLVGNNGPIDPDGAGKVTHFLQMMDQVGRPVVFLNNTTGYMVGTASERGGMIKAGAKMIQAVTNLRVPKIALYVGASFGAGNYGMCGYGFGADFLFTWPNARTGVMGGGQAALTMEQVARRAAARRGLEVDEARLSAQRQKIIDHFDGQSDAFYTSGRGLDMGMIDPRDSRRVIGFCIDTCLEARQRRLNPNSFGVARI